MPDHIGKVYLYYWQSSVKELRYYVGTINTDGPIRYFVKEGTTRNWFTVSDKEGSITTSGRESNGAIKSFWFWLRTDNRLIATQIFMNHINGIIRAAEEAKSNALITLTASISDTVMET